jgi:hypothetical protein
LKGDAQWSGHHDHLTSTTLDFRFWGFLKVHECILLKSEIFVALSVFHTVVCPSQFVEWILTDKAKRLKIFPLYPDISDALVVWLQFS